MNQKKKMAIILASILALMLVGAAVASKIIASDPYRLPSVKHRPTETPVVTAEPTAELTAEPTAEPTEEPVVEPTEEPVIEPTEEPVVEPTEEPVVEPTEEPTVEPTAEPTETPKPYDGPIAVGNAEVHAAPDADSPVVFTVPNGAAIKVFSTEGDWAKVEAHGFSGYLHRDHVRGVAFAQPAATPVPEQPENITENDLPDNARLLGVIQDKLSAERSVSVYASYDGEYVTFGDTVTLYAVLHGYEDTVYTLQWQSSPDNASWADISGAVSASYAVTVTEANYTDYYRVAVTINGVIVADELLAEAAK